MGRSITWWFNQMEDACTDYLHCKSKSTLVIEPSAKSSAGRVVIFFMVGMFWIICSFSLVEYFVLMTNYVLWTIFSYNTIHHMHELIWTVSQHSSFLHPLQANWLMAIVFDIIVQLVIFKQLYNKELYDIAHLRSQGSSHIQWFLLCYTVGVGEYCGYMCR